MFFKTNNGPKLNEEDKTAVLNELSLRIGSDILESADVYNVENELLTKRNHLQACLMKANDEVPQKLSTAVKKAEENSKQIKNVTEKKDILKQKIELFLKQTSPLKDELANRFDAIRKLEEVLLYLKSLEKIDDISLQLKQCNDDEQVVLLYGELKELYGVYTKGHRSTYVKEYVHYWHNILRDKFIKQYEDLLKLLKWPIVSAEEHTPPPVEVLSKFSNVTRYLFLIEEPKMSGDSSQDLPCGPVKMLLRPLKKRFAFHFMSNRQTARLDRPEWFLTQTLTWIKDHQSFIRRHVQPVADKLQMRHVNIEDEFNNALITLAAERLHSVLGMYYTQGQKGQIMNVDAAFAHAVDETLGFHKELKALAGKENNTVLSVLTKAETFLRWLGVERKYARAKMDETLSSDQWMEPICPTVGEGGAAGWVPRGADWFISLLKTIEERYAVLPQPGHRLQFLELQLELLEEWRVRLTQLQHAAMDSLTDESFLNCNHSSHLLVAVLNAAHHTRTVLLQWAHSLHYLQLHYYRRQFQHFTQQQHHDEECNQIENSHEELPSNEKDIGADLASTEPPMSLDEVEKYSQTRALYQVARENATDAVNYTDTTENWSAMTIPPAEIEAFLPTYINIIQDSDGDEAGVFNEAPALLAHLRDAGLAALAHDHMLLEFKAALRDYKKQKWHAMSIVEEMALSVSPALCRPLGGLCARMHAVCSRLAPALASKLRALVAAQVDQHIFEEVVLQSWFNTGGTMQLTHDVKRNLVPSFAPPNKLATSVNQLPKLLEACTLLNMDYDDARRLRTAYVQHHSKALEILTNQCKIRQIKPAQAIQILNQRTDLSDTSPQSVMELF